MKFGKSVLVLSFVLLVGLGCNDVEQAIEGTTFGTPREMRVGDTIQYEDGLNVQLTAINDSRCAADVQCFWEGELAAELLVNGGELGVIGESIYLGTSTTPSVTRGSYVFSLGDISTSSATVTVSLCESCDLIE